jgi:hypothetical protein
MTETQPAAATPPAPAASSPAPEGDGTIERIVTDAEECIPFLLNPAFISLGLPTTAFKTEVGGTPTQGR